MPVGHGFLALPYTFLLVLTQNQGQVDADPGRSPCTELGTCVTMTFHQRLQSEQASRLLHWHFIFLSLVSTCSAAPILPYSTSVHPHRDLISYLDIPGRPVEPYFTLRNLEVAKGSRLSSEGG